MVSLPSTLSFRIATNNPTVIRQYRRILTAEVATQEAYVSSKTQSAKQSLGDELVCLRVLGQTVQQIDNREGLALLTVAIESCQDAAKLVALGRFCLRYFVRIFYRPTKYPTERSSPPSLEQERVQLVLNMQQGTLSHSQAKNLALERDGYRCLVTGAYHRTDVETSAQLKHKRATGQSTVNTNAAHIIPEHLNNFTRAPLDDAAEREFSRILDVDDATSEPKINRNSDMWTMLKNFGSQKLIDELHGKNIHRLENIITIGMNEHDAMDSLQLWFEPTGVLNEYTVHVRNESYRPMRPSYTDQYKFVDVEKVTFISTPELPAPSPQYLALHAACCRISALSGAGDHISKVDRDFDDLKSIVGFQVSQESLDAMSRALQFGYGTQVARDDTMFDQKGPSFQSAQMQQIENTLHPNL
ncbi:hypothetical protein B0H11DRAFT_2199258 [Mycena galericulata]|nr:hypothetical protein B0H11DRAFT_2199258 [Mycena galericulata]